MQRSTSRCRFRKAATYFPLRARFSLMLGMFGARSGAVLLLFGRACPAPRRVGHVAVPANCSPSSPTLKANFISLNKPADGSQEVYPGAVPPRFCPTFASPLSPASRKMRRDNTNYI
ncbi:hypothetical protein E2C01_032962 [Portunus trituberculatus]|uniref:Uncharacterized protein n=1 Tax=Portunus trituberculatus TaxID=210409 RepID=A0A5B7F253_PORTR|nr:hypothetical protein [Portunus trituberculatus]